MLLLLGAVGFRSKPRVARRAGCAGRTGLIGYANLKPFLLKQGATRRGLVGGGAPPTGPEGGYTLRDRHCWGRRRARRLRAQHQPHLAIARPPG
jgi:hypothetical protein